MKYFFSCPLLRRVCAGCREDVSRLYAPRARHSHVVRVVGVAGADGVCVDAIAVVVVVIVVVATFVCTRRCRSPIDCDFDYANARRRAVRNTPVLLETAAHYQ